MKIYIDFDDVICETARHFVKIAKELFGIDLPYSEVQFFNLQKAFNLNDEQYEQLMKEGHTPETLLAYEETPGASKAINKWIDEGHDVYVITGRPFDSFEPSRKWLDEHGLKRAPLYCVDKYGRENYVQKWTYSMTLEDMYKMDFDFAVEDSPSAFDHLLHFPKCRVAVFDRPWNKNAEFPGENFIRCNGWEEISVQLNKKNNLLFYDAYENFYSMTETSKAFKAFCRDAFGEDFSQDGFSDINQVNMILPYIPEADSSRDNPARILDIGCGNGKMLSYLQGKTNCCICGFDYSEHAIESAKNHLKTNAEFRTGVIGEIEYPEEYFDVIISMDTMYFSKDMTAFVGQIKRWLKTGGTFFAAYQEGDVMPKTFDVHTTELAKSFRANNIEYSVTNITKQTYEMLKKKRQAAILHKEEFLQEGNKEWFDLLMWQTDCATENYDEFAAKMSRYIYIVKK